MTLTTPGATAPVAEKTLTPLEIEQARLFIHQARNAAVGAIKGLSDAQWRFRPAPDVWSIAENMDHMIFVQERVLGPVLGQLATAPPAQADRDCSQVDAVVINQFSNRL